MSSQSVIFFSIRICLVFSSVFCNQTNCKWRWVVIPPSRHLHNYINHRQSLWVICLSTFKRVFLLKYFCQTCRGGGGYKGSKVTSICNVTSSQLETQKEDVDEIFLFWRLKDWKHNTCTCIVAICTVLKHCIIIITDYNNRLYWISRDILY